MKNNKQKQPRILQHFFLSLFFFILINTNAAVKTATVNGSWTTGSTWSGNSVPACGDSIVIPAGLTVTITADANYTACSPTTGYLKIAIYGCLHFTNGNRLRLPCNSRIYIMPGPPTGSVVPGAGGGNSTYIELCNDNLWQAADGVLSGPSCLPSNLPGCGQVLPIELTNFTAAIEGAVIKLDWTTASEKNNSHFEIERSTDAAVFQIVKKVPSKALNGTSTTPTKYSELDENPLNTTGYYRLKQTDLDNSYKYSKIVSVAISKAKNLKFLVYPNPNNGEFTVDISGLENNHHVKVSLRDTRGILVYDSSFYLQEASNKIQISPAVKLSKGIYTCTFTLEEIEYSVKMVVS